MEFADAAHWMEVARIVERQTSPSVLLSVAADEKEGGSGLMTLLLPDPRTSDTGPPFMAFITL